MSNNMSLDDYNKTVKRRNLVIWGTLITYILVAFIFPFLIDPLSTSDMMSSLFTIGYVAIIIGGLVMIYIVLLYPLFRKVEKPEVGDGILRDGILNTTDMPEVYYERIRVFLLYEFMIPFTFFISGLTVFIFLNGEIIAGIYTSAILLLFLVILKVFNHLDVSATEEHLRWHYGPIGKKVALDDIETIRSESVHPLKDFKGWGLRISMDGTIGYIARGKVGVRIKLTNGKKYMITVKDPDTLVRFVQFHQKKRRSKKIF